MLYFVTITYAFLFSYFIISAIYNDRWLQYFHYVPCTLRNNTAIITNGWVKVNTLYLFSVFIIDNLPNLTAQKQNILRTLWMSVNRYNRSRKQYYQHTLAGVSR